MAEVQTLQPITETQLDEQQRQTLESILTPHLRLEPKEDELSQRPRPRESRQINEGIKNQQQRVLQNTVETDNKRRPGILKRNSLRYQVPPPEPPDPNSEPKSAVIKRMQFSLEGWNEKLQEIAAKKKRNDMIQKVELDQRDNKISDLTNKFSNECKLRSEIEKERAEFAEQLRITEEHLREQKLQDEQLCAELMQCEFAYQQAETRRQELEQENTEIIDKLQQIEEMKRRLNDQVTELQGQVSMLQRSGVCTIL